MNGDAAGVKPTHAIPLAVAATLVCLTSCTTTQQGTATPTSASDPGSSSATVSNDWWKHTNACNLINQATATQLGFPQAGQQQDGQPFYCTWTASDGSVFSVVLDGTTYDSLTANMGQLSDLTVAGRPAKQDAQAGGDPHGCDIAVQATNGSRALITVNTLNSTVTQACTLAQNVATAVAAKLPSGSK